MYPIKISEEQKMLIENLRKFLKDEMVEDDKKYGDIEIKVRDIGETEKSAGRAVRALARDKDVIAIIGPLITSATDAV